MYENNRKKTLIDVKFAIFTLFEYWFWLKICFSLSLFPFLASLWHQNAIHLIELHRFVRDWITSNEKKKRQQFCVRSLLLLASSVTEYQTYLWLNSVWFCSRFFCFKIQEMLRLCIFSVTLLHVDKLSLNRVHKILLVIFCYRFDDNVLAQWLLSLLRLHRTTAIYGWSQNFKMYWHSQFRNVSLTQRMDLSQLTNKS